MATSFRRAGFITAGLATCVMSASALAQTTVTMWTFLDPNKTSPREVALKQMHRGVRGGEPVDQDQGRAAGFRADAAEVLSRPPDRRQSRPCLDRRQESRRACRSPAPARISNAARRRKWPQADTTTSSSRPAGTPGMNDGKLVALPLFHGASVIYYRKDLLKAAGIDPASLKTWDALNEAAKKLTVDRDSDGRIDVWGFGMPLAPIKTESTPALIGLLDQPAGVYRRLQGELRHRRRRQGAELYGVLLTDAQGDAAGSAGHQCRRHHRPVHRRPLRHGDHLEPSLQRHRQGRRPSAADNIGILAWPSWTGASRRRCRCRAGGSRPGQKSPRLTEAAQVRSTTWPGPRA